MNDFNKLAILDLAAKRNLLLRTKRGYTIFTDDTGNILFYAIYSGNVHLLESLLKDKSYVKMVLTHPDNEMSPLHIAILFKQNQAVKILLELGADLFRGRDFNGNTPIGSVISSNDFNMFKLFVKHSKSKNNLCELLPVVIDNHPPIFTNFLLEHGCDVNAHFTYYFDQTALHLAMEWKKYEHAKILLNHGADVNAVDRYGSTVLHHICMGWDYDLEMVSMLVVEHGANIGIGDKDGHAPIHWAVLAEHYDVLQLLINNNADVNVKDCNGRTPLFMCILYKKPLEFVYLLLNHGADINIADSDGETPLHMACACDNVQCVKELVERGADIQSVTQKGDTPLHFAAACRSENVIDFLLQYEADINIKNMQGETPLCVIIEEECWDEHLANLRFNEPIVTNLLIHMIKLIALSIDVGDTNLKYMRSSLYHEYLSFCEDEIKLMKLEKIVNSYMSVYDVLTASDKRITKISRNESLCSTLKSGNYLDQFPMYSPIIKGRMNKGKLKCDLLNKGNRVLQITTLPLVCRDQILDFLSLTDLSNIAMCIGFVR